MGNTISHVMDWLGRVLVEGEDIQSEIVIYVVFIFMSLTFCLIFARFYLRNQELYQEDKNYGGHDIDDKIERLKRNCMALKMIEAIYYNLNFRGYKAMICEKYPDETSQGRLQETINVVGELMKRNLKITLKLSELTFPMIKDITHENPPDEIEVEDALAMLMLMKQSLGRNCPLYNKNLKFGDSIYPIPMEERIEDIKKRLENFDELVMLQIMLDDNPENNKDRLMNMLRKGKIKLVQNELRALECVMREKSKEYLAAQSRSAQRAGDEPSIVQDADVSNVIDDGVVVDIPDYLFSSGFR